MINLRKVGLVVVLAAVFWVLAGDLAYADDGKLFSALIDSGKKIFGDLRDLVYIVAGFGFIAVGVGGIFGNLNWKWFGAIIISLVVIATAGEIITWMTGSSHGITNTLTEEKAKEAGIEADGKYTPGTATFSDTLYEKTLMEKIHGL